jgi:ABC-2 type transport system permease protein
MRKVWTIARREFAAMVATKAFLLSITLMPVLMFGGILLAGRMNKMGDTSDRRIAIADGTGGALFGDLERAAQARNAWLTKAAESAEPLNVESAKKMLGRKALPEGAAVKYLLERQPKDALADADRLALSEKVRQGDIKAFVEIPANIVNPEVNGGAGASGQSQEVRFHSSDALFSMERQWLEQALNDAVKTRRLKELDLDPEAVRKATAAVPVVSRGLVKQLSGGRVGGADEKSNMAAMLMPFAFMMLMFMVIMLSAQPLLESAIEEKSGRIAEVLLGSVSSFQLMLGKLLGNVAGSLSAVAIYGVGGYALAKYNGWTDLVPWDLVPWFLVFQILAVMLFSSLFLAVGAAVTQLKEAQAMLLPIWLLMCAPMMVWLQIVREPNGPIATWLTFFPPSTALVMVLRLASEEVVPMWQAWGALAVLVATTAIVTYLAGRVFRIGILWQGKTPKLRELARWALAG